MCPPGFSDLTTDLMYYINYNGYDDVIEHFKRYKGGLISEGILTLAGPNANKMCQITPLSRKFKFSVHFQFSVQGSNLAPAEIKPPLIISCIFFPPIYMK